MRHDEIIGVIERKYDDPRQRAVALIGYIGALAKREADEVDRCMVELLSRQQMTEKLLNLYEDLARDFARIPNQISPSVTAILDAGPQTDRPSTADGWRQNSGGGAPSGKPPSKITDESRAMDRPSRRADQPGRVNDAAVRPGRHIDDRGIDPWDMQPAPTDPMRDDPNDACTWPDTPRNDGDLRRVSPRASGHIRRDPAPIQRDADPWPDSDASTVGW